MPERLDDRDGRRGIDDVVEDMDEAVRGADVDALRVQLGAVHQNAAPLLNSAGMVVWACSERAGVVRGNEKISG